MPELDFAFLADHVRVEGGVAHVLAAGIDTITAPTVPTGQNIGVHFRLGFTRQECGRPHRIEIIFQDEDGRRLLQLANVVTPEWTPTLPPHWRQGLAVGMNLGVPLPHYGLYSFELMVNDEARATLPLRVIPQEQAPTAARVADEPQ